ncbi:MAG: hypothetical protein HY644_10905 [Acidobacteria bacterium]|nr:hypothetical protein [Acidobacteriota bacterium]
MASAYIPDPRAQHFWDLWSFAAKAYTTQLKFPKDSVAWDIFVIYKPQLLWGETPPEPTVWLQDLNIAHGTQYSLKLLQAELEKWIQ